PGHSTQAGFVASQAGAAAYLGRYVVVVDDDVDLYRMDEVWRAIFMRVDPERDVQFIRRAWSGPLDQAIQPELRGLDSPAFIDATRPWEERDSWAPPRFTGETAAAARARGRALLAALSETAPG